jgi:hypothetical protein
MGGRGDIADPEAARLDELLHKAERGGASEAESEELALYAAADSALEARIEAAGRRGELGRGWLERVHKDDALRRMQTEGRVRLERGAALGLGALGFLLMFLNPALGITALGSGVVVLLYSVIRVRARTHRDDPYKDVQR